MALLLVGAVQVAAVAVALLAPTQIQTRAAQAVQDWTSQHF
jgi:hypothetical protein